MGMNNTTFLERYYNAPLADVYAGMKTVLSAPENSFKFESCDDLSCSVVFSSGISFSTWGEQLTASAVPSGDGTVIRLTVAGKVDAPGLSFQSSHNLKVAERFFNDLSKALTKDTGKDEEMTTAVVPLIEPNPVGMDQNPQQPKEKLNGKPVIGIVGVIVVAIILICVFAGSSNSKSYAARLEWLRSLESACNAADAIDVLDDDPNDASLTVTVSNNGKTGIEPLRCIAANTNMPEKHLTEIVNSADTENEADKELRTFSWDAYQVEWQATQVRVKVGSFDSPASLFISMSLLKAPSNMTISSHISDFHTEDSESSEAKDKRDEEPEPFDIELNCSTRQSDSDIGTNSQRIDGVTSLNYQEKTWNTGQLISCSSDEKDSEATGEKSTKEYEALTTAYGDDAYTTTYGLGSLYSICASTAMPQMGMDVISKEQGEELLGALVLCPNHPRAAEITQKVGADANRLNEVQEKRAQGLIKDDGTYKIPSEMASGIWRTMSDKVTNCYWEIQDSSGQIMSNDFIPGGIGQTITIPENAAGFYSEGCGAWEKQ